MQAVVITGIVAQAIHWAYSWSLQQRIKRKEAEVQALSIQRSEERLGRTKAEREIRDLQLKLGQYTELTATTDTDKPDFLRIPFPLKAIGILKSCFNHRNGTPRQPLLVTAARSQLTLRPDLAAAFLEGLSGYSHCIIIYIFHENTDLQRLWQPDSMGVKAKIRVPRLNGRKLGVYATRSPHRPCPIGLSVAKIIAVKGNTLILGGADIVNGTPILDIKPYIPFCDSIPDATAPSWVAPHAADDEPLEIESVNIPPEVDQAIEQCWKSLDTTKTSLYDSYSGYRALITQVLSRDIRSVTQRIKVPNREKLGLNTSLSLNTESSAAQGDDEAAGGKWHVVLDGIDLSYEVDDQRAVWLRSAALVSS